MGRDRILEPPPRCPGEEPREEDGDREALCRCCLLTAPPASQAFLVPVCSLAISGHQGFKTKTKALSLSHPVW